MTLSNCELSNDILYVPVSADKDEEKKIEFKDVNGVLLYPEISKDIKIEIKQKFCIIKNLIILSVAFMFVFTSFQSLQNLQSTLNTEDDIGTLSLSIFYMSLIVSSLFLPSFIIGHFGCKTTLCISIFSYCLFTAGNFKGNWTQYILPLTAVVAGLGSAPLWAAQGKYINTLSKQLAQLSNEEHKTITALCFGIFAFFFASAQIWGNLLASCILGVESEDYTLFNRTKSEVEECGKNFCPSDVSYSNHTNFVTPLNEQVYILCSVYLILNILAIILILLFLDNIKEHEMKSETKLSLSTLTKTILNIKDPRQALLIPQTIFVGIQLAFMASEFTAAFISCTWGIDKIGFVMMSYGIINCISSIVFGFLVKFIGRIPIFILAMLINISLLTVMLTWSPSIEMFIIFFVIASLWGMGDAVWQSQCMGLVILFNLSKTIFGKKSCQYVSILFLEMLSTTNIL